MIDIGLNEYHESNIIKFIKFSRSQRALSIRTIQAAFKEIQQSRLRHENTFTVDEVIDLLGELWDYAKEEIDIELSHQAHTYTLLLRQLFLQAEHWHLKMNADISELENKELLDKIRNFENEQFSSKKQPSARLEPVNDTGGTLLLREKINHLEEENQVQREKIRYLEKQLSDFSQSSSSKGSSRGGYSQESMADLEDKMNQLKKELSSTRDMSSAKEKSIENEMIAMKHRYLEIQEQLRMAERELERKFNQTNAYKNMKQMLDKKNEQIKDLRRRLNRYEPVDD